MAQHKWHHEIKAWADGAEIEARFKDPIDGWSKWITIQCISVFDDSSWEFRIKPQPKEPQYVHAYLDREKQIVVWSKNNENIYPELYTYLGKIKLEVEEDESFKYTPFGGFGGPG